MQKVKNYFHFVKAIIALLWYGFPAKKMTVIGITGTSGKTTCAHLIYHLLTFAGKKASLISTIKAVIIDKTYDTGLHVTTPSPLFLQKLIKEAYTKGSRYLVLEVTSHSLDQFRVLGSSIDIAVITNVTHEHLDYHKNFNAYLRTKAKILSGVKLAVLNKDDVNFSYLKKIAPRKILTYSLKGKADFNWQKNGCPTALLGNFNKLNILAAVSVLRHLGIEMGIVRKGVASFTGISGRMEKINNRKNINIYVDFAHKPDALLNVLKTLKPKNGHKLIAVFGSAGLRDKTKRPIMGEIAARYADYSILTAEDPRTEDVRKINAQIAAGLVRNKAIELNKKLAAKVRYSADKYFFQIPDRQEALNFAIRKLARRGDTVVTMGKGHEKSMCYGRVEYPWDEKKAIEKALYD